MSFTLVLFGRFVISFNIHWAKPEDEEQAVSLPFGFSMPEYVEDEL